MQLSDAINEQYVDATTLRKLYSEAPPFPHIVLEDFIKEDLLRRVSSEFPDLAKLENTGIRHINESRQIKFASLGMRNLSPAALELHTYLQSDLMMYWLNDLTGIKEPLIADPYLSGGGYHEIKPGGLLKVHADYNKHPRLNLDRRVNLLIYLNEDWKNEWGGALQLFDKDVKEARQTVYPTFNTAVIFSTTSYSYHGHPDALRCPENHSRKSLAYYYFSTGRPQAEVAMERHSTLFKERVGESFKADVRIKSIVRDIFPPILVRAVKSLRKYR